MTVPINANATRVQYTATSGQTVFPLPFEFFANSDITVYLNGTELALSTDPASASEYSVSGANVEGGGAIRLGGAGAALNDIVTVLRAIPIERTTDFPLAGPFNIDALNSELSRIIAMIQQVETAFSQQTLRINPSDSPVIPALSSAAARANKYLAFGSDGQLALSAGVGQATAAGMVTTTDGSNVQAALNARPVQGSDIAPETYGAVGGNTNDTAAFESAIVAASISGRRIRLTASTYSIGAITVPSNVGFYSDNGSAIRPHSSVSASASLITIQDGATNVSFEGIVFEDPSNRLSSESAMFINGGRQPSGGVYDPTDLGLIDFTVTNCTFRDMLARCVRVNTLNGGTITRNIFQNNRPHAALLDENSAEIYLTDTLRNVEISHNLFYGKDTSQSPWGSRELAIILSSVNADTYWENVRITDNASWNYRRSQVVCATEHLTDTEQDANAVWIERNRAYWCGMQAFKWKGGIRTFTNDNIAYGFETICQEVPSTHRGGIWMQYNSQSTCNYNQLTGKNLLIHSGLARSGNTSTTVKLPNWTANQWGDATFDISSGASVNAVTGKLVYIRSGALAGQWRVITAWDKATNTATVAAWTADGATTAPDTTSQIEVYSNPSVGIFVNANLYATMFPWATTTAYVLGDYVVQAGVVYVCRVAHTAGTFATDLAAGNWKVSTWPDHRGRVGFQCHGNEFEEVETCISFAGPLYQSSFKDIIAYNCATAVRNTARSGWVTGTSYIARSFVFDPANNGTVYICLVDHTAGTFATDLAAGKWVQAECFRSITVDGVQFRGGDYPNPGNAAPITLSDISELVLNNIGISGAWHNGVVLNRIRNLRWTGGLVEGCGYGVTARYAASFTGVSGQVIGVTLGGINAGTGQSFAASFSESVTVSGTPYSGFTNALTFIGCNFTGNASASARQSGAFNMASFAPSASVIFADCRGAGTQAGTKTLSDADAVHYPSLDGGLVALNVPLTAARSVALNSNNLVDGTEVAFARTAEATGAFNLTVGGPAWVTTTVYSQGDAVVQGGVVYQCLVGHTAGTFATDLAAARWSVLAEPATLTAGTSARYRYSRALSRYLKVG